MKVKYSQEVDALYITLTGSDIEESDEVSSGVIVDYDKDKNIVGIEILNVSQSKDFEYVIREYLKKVA